jgi:hypothetical protein
MLVNQYDKVLEFLFNPKNSMLTMKVLNTCKKQSQSSELKDPPIIKSVFL